MERGRLEKQANGSSSFGSSHLLTFSMSERGELGLARRPYLRGQWQFSASTDQINERDIHSDLSFVSHTLR